MSTSSFSLGMCFSGLDGSLPPHKKRTKKDDMGTGTGEMEIKHRANAIISGQSLCDWSGEQCLLGSPGGHA